MILNRIYTIGFFVAAVAAACTLCFAPAAMAESTADTGFTLKVGAVCMTREGEHNYPLVRELGTGAVLINSSDLKLGWAPGVDLSAGYSGERFTAEARYLGGLDWEDDTDIRLAPNGLILNHHAPLFGLGLLSCKANYDSQLHSAELNFGWKPIEDVTVFIGPRLALVDEELTVQSVFLSVNNHTKDITSVENMMLGGQIGVKGKVLKTAPLCVDAFAKCGYFNNEITVNQRLNQKIGDSYNAHSEADNETFMAEAGIDANIKISDHLALNAGYQALWIGAAANAPDEFVSSTLIVGSRVMVNTEDVIYHGGKASLVVSW